MVKNIRITVSKIKFSSPFFYCYFLFIWDLWTSGIFLVFCLSKVFKRDFHLERCNFKIARFTIKWLLTEGKSGKRGDRTSLEEFVRLFPVDSWTRKTFRERTDGEGGMTFRSCGWSRDFGGNFFCSSVEVYLSVS